MKAYLGLNDMMKFTKCARLPFVSVAAARDVVENRRQRTLASSSGRSGMDLPAAESSITSVNNSYVKHLVKVRTSSSYRQDEGSVLVPGASAREGGIMRVPSCQSAHVYWSQD